MHFMIPLMMCKNQYSCIDSDGSYHALVMKHESIANFTEKTKSGDKAKYY